MKAKGVVLVVSLLLTLCAFSTGGADTVLFPVIAVNQPNVTTIVSVYNSPVATATHLTYTYRFKNSLTPEQQPNISGGCTTQPGIVRPTHGGDLVSFDVSGSANFNSGNAMFGDTDNYGGGFALTGTGPRRAYLLVTQSDDQGNPVDDVAIGDPSLGGEAILLDIAFGAAWGYRAINDSNFPIGDPAQAYTFVSTFNSDAAIPFGGTASTLTSTSPFFADRKSFSFFPLPGSADNWSTRFFVTPTVSTVDTNMLSDQTASVGLSDTVIDRAGTSHPFPSSVTKSVTCTAAVDLPDLIDSTVLSAVQNTGGWSWFQVFSGDAIVFKLEFVVQNQLYGGTNNNGYLLSIPDFGDGVLPPLP